MKSKKIEVSKFIIEGFESNKFKVIDKYEYDEDDIIYLSSSELTLVSNKIKVEKIDKLKKSILSYVSLMHTGFFVIDLSNELIISESNSLDDIFIHLMNNDKVELYWEL